MPEVLSTYGARRTRAILPGSSAVTGVVGAPPTRQRCAGVPPAGRARSKAASGVQPTASPGPEKREIPYASSGAGKRDVREAPERVGRAGGLGGRRQAVDLGPRDPPVQWRAPLTSDQSSSGPGHRHRRTVARYPAGVDRRRRDRQGNARRRVPPARSGARSPSGPRRRLGNRLTVCATVVSLPVVDPPQGGTPDRRSAGRGLQDAHP